MARTSDVCMVRNLVRIVGAIVYIGNGVQIACNIPLDADFMQRKG